MPKGAHNLKAVESALTQRLKLQSPQFFLERAGTKVSGSIVSASFQGLRDSQRQGRIWAALDAEYGANSVDFVGTLLAFTPDEWNIDGALSARGNGAPSHKAAGG